MLRREDLEDCLSQAVCELLARARRGQRFSSRDHLANALEQRFVSRVYDRRRAVRGRSPLQAHLESALPWSGPGDMELELADPRAEIPPLVAHRYQLRQVARLAPLLTPDQRLVLACQVALGMDRAEFCRRFGWSFEKYRKVAQRARARLRGLIDAEPWEGGRDPAAGRRHEPAAGEGTYESAAAEGGNGPAALDAGLGCAEGDAHAGVRGRRGSAALGCVEGDARAGVRGRRGSAAAEGGHESAVLDAGLGCAEGDARAGVPARGEPCAHGIAVAVSHSGGRVGTER